MKLAYKAFLEYSLVTSKKKLIEKIMEAASNEQRSLIVKSLECSDNLNSNIIEWLLSEGFVVEPLIRSTYCESEDKYIENSEYIIKF